MELAEALSLVIFYSGAFLMPLVASRAHVPAAVAEIVFGLTIGAAGIVHKSNATEFLAELGFMYLMFLVGMEIDFNRIEREGRKTVLMAFLVSTLVLVTAMLIVTRLDMPPFMALVIGAMSVGVLLVALVESGASKTRSGQIFLLVGSIGEFLTLLALAGYDLVEQHGFSSELVTAALRVVMLFLVALALLAAMRLTVWWFPHSFKRWVREEDPSELGVRFGFVLMLGLAALATWVGLESIVGAFLAGILFAYIFRETGVLETKLVALGQGFFVPIFFINVGVTFEWAALGDVSTLGRTLVVLGAASLVAKFLPSVLLLFLGLGFRAVAAGAFLLATPLTLLVAIAALGRELQVIDPSMSAAVILLAIVTGVLFPTLFKLITPKPPQAPEVLTPARSAPPRPPDPGASALSPE
jgi:Kef-type K+ transport system membrane component KefB